MQNEEKNDFLHFDYLSTEVQNALRKSTNMNDRSREHHHLINMSNDVFGDNDT